MKNAYLCYAYAYCTFLSMNKERNKIKTWRKRKKLYLTNTPKNNLHKKMSRIQDREQKHRELKGKM